MKPSELSSPKDSKPRDVFQTAGTAGSILNSEPLDGSNRGMYITVSYVKNGELLFFFYDENYTFLYQVKKYFVCRNFYVLSGVLRQVLYMVPFL